MASQQSENIVQRLSEIPMVSASFVQVSNIYRLTKSSNKYFESALNFVENVTKTAVDSSQPILKVLDGPLVASNKLACKQLSKIQEKYPAMMKTPEEVVQQTVEYYDNSPLKTTVDKTLAAKDYAIVKLKEANSVCEDGRTKLVYVLDRCFKVSDCIIDTYIAVPKSSTEEPSTSENVDQRPYLAQIYRMTTKVTDGILYRTQVSKVNFDAQAAKNQTMEIFNQVQQKAASYETNSEKVLLNLVHRMAVTVIFISDRMVRVSAAYLPEKGEKLVVVAANYVQNVNQGLSDAQSLEEVKQKTMEEAKNGVVFVSSNLLTIINYARAHFWSRLTKISPFITNQEYDD